LGTASGGTSHRTPHHAHTAIVAVASIFIAIVCISTARGSTTWVLLGHGLKLIHIDSLEEETAGEICIVLGHGEGLDAQVAWLIGDRD
jgi:hypothetical protein